MTTAKWVKFFAMSLLAATSMTHAADEEHPVERTYVSAPAAPAFQTWADAQKKSTGCVSCHTQSDRKTMHATEAVVLGCTDCHGGDPNVFAPPGETYSADAAGKARGWSSGYLAMMDKAHVLPRYPDHWPGSANPQRSYTALLKEAPEFVRFINPGDLRAANEACGACHLPVIQANEKSLMANAAMFWGAAAYNNGILPYKHSVLGEAYTNDGQPATTDSQITPDANMTAHGVLPKIAPMPSWETTPVADIFRVFERGGRNIGTLFPETGLPDVNGEIQKLEEPGRPDLKQSNRGPGTGNRVAIPVLNIHKTRLNDPFIWMLGTNDNPGDYRSSGCSSCHVVYANDRDQFHSAIYASAGNMGTSQQIDPTIPKNESGHPLKHEFTRQIPTSQCMICHMHQPNMFINTMLGYTMWDYESDAPAMWPAQQKYPSDAEARAVLDRNPEEAAIRGKWSDVNFVKDVSLLNPQLKDTQFADYHGHGWNFRGVYSRDRKGDLLDKNRQIVTDDDPDKWKKAVHLQSIHVDVGMQCVDCHYAQDAHGDGYVKAEVMAAVALRQGSAAYPQSRWQEALRVDRWEVDPALGGDSGTRMDAVAREGHRGSSLAALQRKSDARAYGRNGHGLAALGCGCAAGPARARRRQDGLLHLPYVMDDKLWRVSFADPGELENRAAQIRGRLHAQLRDLQPAGCARRHVLPRRAR
jgi:hypothetical protein